MLRSFIRANSSLSKMLDRPKLLRALTIDGKIDFQNDFVWEYLASEILIYDVGGGKAPFLSAQQKQLLRAQVLGLDISASELSQAPPGLYDGTIAADIMAYSGRGDGDVVICQTLLEHVSDTAAALSGITTLLKPGGVC